MKIKAKGEERVGRAIVGLPEMGHALVSRAAQAAHRP